MCALPYVYRLTHKETGQFYIGYREANNLPAIEDLPLYQTSSTKVHTLGFENFSYVILIEFTNGRDAYDFENRLIEQNIKDPLCLNGHYTKNNKNRYRFVGTHSDKTRAKMSADKLGKSLSHEHIAALLLNRRKGPHTAETIAKMSAAKIGRPLSQAHKTALSISRKGVKPSGNGKLQ